MTGPLHDTVTVTPRRADYGQVRLGRRDIDGLILCAEHYGAPYDLLAAALGAQPARLRQDAWRMVWPIHQPARGFPARAFRGLR